MDWVIWSTPGSRWILFRGAVSVLREQWTYMENGRLALSDNRAKCSIKPFVIDRKNWLFSNIPVGAQSSVVIYSRMKTAKENDLTSYRYLVRLLSNAPRTSPGRVFLPVNTSKNAKFQNYNGNVDRYLDIRALRWQLSYTPRNLAVTDSPPK